MKKEKRASPVDIAEALCDCVAKYEKAIEKEREWVKDLLAGRIKWSIRNWYELAKRVEKLAYGKRADLTFRQFEEGWQYRNVGGSYEEAKTELANLLAGWY